MEITFFDNENITISKRKNRNEQHLTDEEINIKYAEGEVRIVTEQARYQLPSIPTMLQSEDYILNPEFQRRHRWDRGQKSRLIESFIMNIPIPPIFLYEKEYSTYEVMDGLQRLSAISDFYSDKFALGGLEFWTELEGKKYSQLPSLVKKGIDRRFLSAVILLKETAKNEEEAKLLKQIVFERINSGGTTLEYQESRNAFYAGRFNTLCKKLSRNKHFCKIFNIPEPTQDDVENEMPSDALQRCDMFKKMKDVETVVRFFAMRYVGSFDMQLKTFLDKFTEAANELPSEVLDQYADLFCKTIELVYNMFGDSAFGVWKSRNEEWEYIKTPNTFLYDPIMYVLSQRLDHADILIQKKDEIGNGIKDLYIANEILRDGRKGSKQDILNRIQLFDEFFNKFI